MSMSTDLGLQEFLGMYLDMKMTRDFFNLYGNVLCHGN